MFRCLWFLFIYYLCFVFIYILLPGQGKTNDSHFYSQFNEDSFIREHRSTPGVFGKGGVALPPRAELSDLLKDGERIKVMCITWNINGKSISSTASIHELFQKLSPQERPDVFAVALQELPSTTLWVFIYEVVYF